MSVFHERTVVPSVEDYGSTLRRTRVNPLLPTWYVPSDCSQVLLSPLQMIYKPSKWSYGHHRGHSKYDR